MAADSDRYRFTVSPDAAGRRVDLFLADRPELHVTRSKIQKAIADELVTVDGVPVSKSHRLTPGETVEVTVVESPPSEVKAEDIPLNIVYADDHIAVIDKPAGMVTHPAVGHASGTLVNAVMHRFGLEDKSGGHRPGIVHRLDKNTSGLILVALNEATQSRLQAMIKEREVKRIYTALVWGHLSEKAGVIDAPIGRSPRDRKKMTVTDRNSREAQTEYRLIERYESFDLLELSLHTGRTHQIRVHLAHLGHPVFGDPDYGGRDKSLRGMFAPLRPRAKEMLGMLGRQALHASRLLFNHPVTQEALSFESSPPEEISCVIRLARTS